MRARLSSRKVVLSDHVAHCGHVAGLLIGARQEERPKDQGMQGGIEQPAAPMGQQNQVP